MKTLLAILSLSIIFGHLSCKKDTKKKCGDIPYSQVSFSEWCQPIVKDKSTSDLFLVIQSLEELKAVVTFENLLTLTDCRKESPLFSTDFSKHTLLIGKKEVMGIRATLVNQSVVKDCDTNSLTYHATVKNGGYTAVGTYVFAILVDKISTDTNVNFNINLSN